MALIIPAAFFIIGLILGGLLFRRPSKVKEVYFDSSGVSSNPPSVFELTAAKTLNVRVDKKHVLRIPQVSAGPGVMVLCSIQQAYGEIVRLITEAEKEGKSVPGEVGVLSLRLIALIASLAMPYSKGGRKFQEALFKRCYEDSAFLMGLCRELVDFWVKKKRLMERLAAGTPSRAMRGEHVYTATLSSQARRIFTMFPFGWSWN